MKIAKFDPEKHQYEDGRLPSVTQVIEEAGLMPRYPDDLFYRERGRAVHLVCQLHDEDDLDPSSIDPQIQGYFDAYVKFLAQMGYHDKPLIEIPLTNDIYAGTPDRIVIKPPRNAWDIKVAKYDRHHALQLAAYVNLLDEPFSYERFALYLSADGTYKIKTFFKKDYSRDLSVFLSALNICIWRQNHGIGS